MMARMCRKENPHTRLVGRCPGQPPWRTVWWFLKQLEIELLYDPAIPLLGIYPKKTENTNLKQYMYSNVHSSVISNCQDMGANQMSTDAWVDKADVVHIYNEILLSHKKNENSPFATAWTDLESVILREIKTHISWRHFCVASKSCSRASLGAQWERILLPTQETWVRSLTQDDPTCSRATRPVHNSWAEALEPASCSYWAHALQQEKPAQWDACGPYPESRPRSPELGEARALQGRPSTAKK